MLTRRSVLMGAAAVPLAMPAIGQSRQKVRFAGGGITIYGYMPFFVAQAQNLFAKHGIDAEIAQFPGGSVAMQAVLGGSSDVACGFYEHTIYMAAKGAKLTTFVLQAQNSGLVLGVREELADKVKGVADIKGMKIGVSAPGSATDLFVKQLMVKAGQKPTDYSAVGVGTTQTASGAFERGDVDGLSLFDPLIADLELRHKIKVLADARTSAGTQAIFGGPYASGSLYAKAEWLEKNPDAARGAAAAIMEAVNFLKHASPEDAIKALPNGMCSVGMEICTSAFTRNRNAYEHDGQVSPVMAQTVKRMLDSFDPQIAAAKIDLEATYTGKYLA